MPTSTRAARRDRKVDGDSGFTLTETLVSITLLALVGGSATTGIVAGLKAQSNNEFRTVGSNLVRSDIDRARAVQYPSYPQPVASHLERVGGKSFYLVRTVTAPDVAGSATCPDTITSAGVLSLTVTSTVTWGDGQKIAMSTVISC